MVVVDREFEPPTTMEVWGMRQGRVMVRVVIEDEEEVVVVMDREDEPPAEMEVWDVGGR